MTSRDRRPRGRTRSQSVQRSGAEAETRTSAPLALWIALALLLALRIAGALAPSPALWAFDPPAHLPLLLSWVPPALLALAVLPPVVRILTPRRGGGEVPGVMFGVGLAFVLVALVLLLPDRLHFVGDANLRFGNLFVDEPPAKLFPQATPLDLALHFALRRALATHSAIPREALPGLWGALTAAALAVTATAAARVLGVRGPAAFAVAAGVAFGGTLALCAGYLKSFLELSVVTAIAGVASIHLARTGRGLMALGLAVAIGLLLHRSGLALVPVWLAGLAIAAGPQRTVVPWRRAATWIGAAAPVVALALALPAMLPVLRDFDVAHHLATPEVARGGGAVAAALAPAHLTDVLNVLLLLAPLAPLVLLTAASPRGRALELVALLALALPLVALTLVIHPQQGLYRDWDVFAPAGMALAVLAAWVAAAALEQHASYAGLGIAVALAAAGPAVQWLTLESDVPRALARIETRLLRAGTPVDERAAGWDFVGMRYVGLGRPADGEEALRRSIEAAPNPRILVEWGVAVLSRGDFPRALPIFQRAAALNPGLIGAWRGIATAASATGNRAELARAAEWIERLNPGDPMAREARAALGTPPDSTR